MEGTQSLCGIYMSSANACQRCCCCDLTNNNHPSSDEEEIMHCELILVAVSLAWVYEYSSNKKIGYGTQQLLEEDDDMQKNILRTLSRLLTYGLIINNNTVGEKKHDFDMEEELSHILKVTQTIYSALGEEEDHTSTALGDMLDLDEETLGEETFIAAIGSKFETSYNNAFQAPPPQLQYLLDMLKSFPRSAIPQRSNAIKYYNAPSSEPSLQEPPQSLTDIQIAHVKSILPSLGDGFIEEALKCYSHDVERTVEALLQMSDEDESKSATTTAATYTLSLIHI